MLQSDLVLPVESDQLSWPFVFCSSGSCAIEIQLTHESLADVEKLVVTTDGTIKGRTARCDRFGEHAERASK
jgi:hypothetical protein